jgi:hypothetical protein
MKWIYLLLVLLALALMIVMGVLAGTLIYQGGTLLALFPVFLGAVSLGLMVKTMDLAIDRSRRLRMARRPSTSLALYKGRSILRS